MRHAVVLDAEQRQGLRALVRSGKAPARKIAHAHALLKADEGKKDAQIAAELGLSPETCYRVRRRFAEEGLESAVEHKHPVRLKPPRLDGAAEARLVALACSPAPEGRARWTLRLLAGKLVDLGVVERGVSHETVRQALKKTSSGRT